jgi:hypothetical protein
MIRLLRFLSGTAAIIGSIWFVVSCGTALSGDMCGGRKMEPGDVCVSSGGGTTTYEEKAAAKDRAPQHLKSAGALFATGVVLNITASVLALRREPDPET